MNERLNFDKVLKEELHEIGILRWKRGVRAKPETGETSDSADASTKDAVKDPENDPTVTAEAHMKQLVGLAFSGGGIRSATFNLGILQSLAQTGLLRHFDYLSTVSGGGYIGSWLVAWIKRGGVQEVEEKLAQEHCTNPSKYDPHAPRKPDDPITPITFLRKFSNYLTPQIGFFSLDTWMAVATYVRNLLLNLNVLIFALACVLLLPRLFVAAVLFLSRAESAWWNHPDLLLAVIGVLVLLVAWAVATRFGADHNRPVLGEQGVFFTVVLPVFLLVTLLVYWLISDSELKSMLIGKPDEYWRWLVGGGTILLAFWLAFAAFLSISRGRKGLRDLGFGAGTLPADHLAGAFAPLAAALAGAIGGWLLWLLMQVGAASDLQPENWLRKSIWAPPAAALILTMSGVYFIGLMGRDLPEAERQWWSRSGAFVTITATAWLVLFVTTFYAPVTLRWAAAVMPTLIGSIGVGWLLSTALGVLAGRSPATNTNATDSKRWLRPVAAVTPFVFIIGLVMLLSFGIDALLPRLLDIEVARPGIPGEPASWQHFASHHQKALVWTANWLDDQHVFAQLAGFWAAIAGIAAILSWRVDINEFSMHNFYRDRLTRAYLGASRERNPNPFTGFDPEDDIDLTKLLDDAGGDYAGPYPIVNAAMNLTSGKNELAWQERKASSFVFTPRHHGYDSGRLETCSGSTGAYRRSEGLHPGTDPNRLSLGTAMTVSGAAANPSMGFHSSPALSFLLTVFNARLGLWMGNPAHEDTWQKKSPTFSIRALIDELFGQTGAESKWVNLADGGFFDNLGVYELVRRRCRFILACDGEGDPELEFNGLGNVIRRCRSDFGIDIRFENLEPLKRRDGTPFSLWHCAVGTIHYDQMDERAPKGILVYIKSSLTGDEPADILNYQRKHDGFPHESTADQWFDESQFESYRRLGEHIGRVVFGAVGLGPRR